MNSLRLDYLLKKAAAKALSAREKDALVSLMNAPIMAQQEKVFASTFDFQETDMSARIAAIDWFGNCGNATKLELTMSIGQANSWALATNAMLGTWEKVQLWARNQLTMWLHNNCNERYQGWNELVRVHKENILNALKDQRIRPFQEKHGLDIVVVHSVSWDILSALMENSYLYTGHHCFFFLEMLRVYEAGHVPCGWVGDWPDGQLIIY